MNSSSVFVEWIDECKINVRMERPRWIVKWMKISFVSRWINEFRNEWMKTYFMSAWQDVWLEISFRGGYVDTLGTMPALGGPGNLDTAALF